MHCTARARKVRTLPGRVLFIYNEIARAIPPASSKSCHGKAYLATVRRLRYKMHRYQKFGATHTFKTQWHSALRAKVKQDTRIRCFFIEYTTKQIAFLYKKKRQGSGGGEGQRIAVSQLQFPFPLGRGRRSTQTISQSTKWEGGGGNGRSALAQKPTSLLPQTRRPGVPSE